MNYKIYLSSTFGNSVIVTPDATPSYNLTGLVNGSLYSIQVAGVNLVGEGAQCDAVTATPLGLAGPPTNVVINYDPDVANSTTVGYQSVDLSYSAPSEDGGSPITSYTHHVQFRSSQGVGGKLTLSWTQDPVSIARNGGSVLIQFNVKDGNGNLVGSVMAHVGQSNYSMPISNLISVCAVNRDGEGAAAVSPDAVPSGLPDAPVGLTLTNVTPLNIASGGSNAHPSDEGSAFDHWQIYRDGVAIESFDTNEFYYGGLVNGQLYNFALSAINGNGEGAQCAQVCIVPSCCPDTVTGLSAAHGNQQVTLSWTPLAVAPSQVASDEGSPILQYQIQMSSDNGTTWADVGECASNVSSFTKMDLINGQSYDFRVSAQNANGMSDTSAPVQCIPSTSPSAVQNVHIVGNASELQVIWDAPTNSGGLPYLYDIQVADINGGVAFMASALSTRYVEATNLAMNIAYTVTIYAYNNVDTNYIMYSTQATTVPNPIEITSLVWDNIQPGLSAMK